MPGEQTWPTQPYPTNPPPFAKQSFGVDDINPYLEPAEYERVQTTSPRSQQQGAVHADQPHRHRPHSGQQRRRPVRRHGRRAEHRRGLRDHPGQSRHAPPAHACRERCAHRRIRAPPDNCSISSIASSVMGRIGAEPVRLCPSSTRTPIRRTTSWLAPRGSVRWRFAPFSRRARAECLRSLTSPPPMRTS